jgi:hypothetical protein
VNEHGLDCILELGDALGLQLDAEHGHRHC